MAHNQPLFLAACANGDLDKVEQLHADSLQGDTTFLQEVFIRAVDNKHPAIVKFLLQHSPPTFASHLPDQVLLHAIDAGPEIYVQFLVADPSVCRRSFGHIGDALAVAVMKNDPELVRLMLDHGSKPSESLLFHKPIIEAVRDLHSTDVDILRALSETK